MIKCEDPYWMGAVCYPCDVCRTCRVRRRKVWTNRLCLEQNVRKYGIIVTLSYDNNYLESKELVKSDYQKWLKKLRKSVYPIRLSYFIAGEYGSKRLRPHYHAIIFGINRMHYTLLEWNGVEKDCFINNKLQTVILNGRLWEKGSVVVDDFNKAGAKYISGYVVKKMDKEKDKRLKGMVPEFYRMSLRPAIGKEAVKKISDVLMDKNIGLGVDRFIKEGPPHSLKIGNLHWPLGRSMRDWIVEEVSKKSAGEIPDKTKFLARQYAEMCSLFEKDFKKKRGRNTGKIGGYYEYWNKRFNELVNRNIRLEKRFEMEENLG